jgi:uncharacterized protein YndB with AHSA1/START domain
MTRHDHAPRGAADGPDAIHTAEATDATGATEAPASTEPTRAAAGEVWIDAPPERVWRALTDARELERWFPLLARVTPGEGGSMRMSWGAEFDEGMEIATWDPPRHLGTLWPWPKDRAVITDYHIEAEGGGTRVRVVTSGFSMDPEWDAWVEGTNRGWAFELRSLKHYLERHDGEDRRALFLRRRVAAPSGDVWSRLVGEGAVPSRWDEEERLDEAPPVQVAALLADPVGAMVRASVEPVHGPDGVDPDHVDATLWLSIWGEQAERVEALDADWTAWLEQAFPEGQTLRERT